MGSLKRTNSGTVSSAVCLSYFFLKEFYKVMHYFPLKKPLNISPPIVVSPSLFPGL